MARILVAEGHEPTRDFVERNLDEAGHVVLLATDSRSVLELYAAHRPDVVVLAADFGGLEVEALTRKLRAQDARLILVVADKEHLGKARGLSAVLSLGANAYVADPTRRDLVDKVGQLVAQSSPARGTVRANGTASPRDAMALGEVRLGTIARLVHQIWKEKTNGVLVVEDGPQERRFLFSLGALSGFLSKDPGETLLRWLAHGGKVNDAQQDAVLEGMAGGLSPGSALVAAGVLEPGEELLATLRHYLSARLARAIGARQGRWRFHADADLGADVAPLDVTAPLKPLLDGGRATLPARHQLEALRAVMEAFPSRGPGFPPLVTAASLSAADLRLALGLEGHQSTREWLEGRRHEWREALSLLWFLSLADGVIFNTSPTKTEPVERNSKKRRRPLPQERAEQLRQAALQILPGSHYQALGLEITADTEDVERAYHEVARRFHPDMFADYEVGDLEDLLLAVQDKVSIAYRSLSTRDKRRQYLGLLVRRLEQAGQRRPGVDADAEVALLRAERALRARRTTQAAEALREAVQRSPKEPEYLALLAFASLFDRALPSFERGTEAIRLARRALAILPDHPRAAAVLAIADSQRGEIQEARRVVVSALKAHPESRLLRTLLHAMNRPGSEPALSSDPDGSGTPGKES